MVTVEVNRFILVMCPLFSISVPPRALKGGAYGVNACMNAWMRELKVSKEGAIENSLKFCAFLASFLTFVGVLDLRVCFWPTLNPSLLY